MVAKLRVPIETVLSRLPENVKLDVSTYCGVKKKARFIDEEYGEFWAVPSDVFHGHGHRLRGNKKLSLAKRKSAESVLAQLPAYAQLDVSTYIDRNTPARFIDVDYGEWWGSPKEVLKQRSIHRNRLLATGRAKTLTAEEISNKLPAHIKLVHETYRGTMRKACFIDEEFGSWWTTANRILQGNNHPNRGKRNRAETCLKKYGVPHVSQDREIHSRMQRNMRRTTTVTHWKTGEEVCCVGSYELAVVNWLNAEKIDFDWQVQFTMSDGHKYYCDLYLKERDVYVEIKGWWMQESSRRKWEEFHSTHPNSELWGRPELKTMGLVK